MKRTLLSAALGRLFTSLCLLIIYGALSAQTVFVDPAGVDAGNCSMPGSPCLTISYAVSQATAGGTVEVAAGTYNENVNIDKSLTLQGTGNPTVQGSDVSLGTFQVLPNVNDVTIDGFTLVGFDAANAGVETAALYLQGAHSNITVTNNTITANGDAGFTEEFGAINDNLIIDGNTFDGQTFPGTQAGGCGFGTQFSDPTVPRQLVVIGNSDTNVQFTNNIVSGIAGSMTTTAGCESTGQGNTLVTIDAPGAVITGNTFSGTTARFASMLRTRGDGNTITGNMFDGTNLISTTTFHFLTDNTLMGGTPATAEDLVAANNYDPDAAIFDGNGSVSIVAGCPVEDTTVFAGEMDCEVIVEFEDANDGQPATAFEQDFEDPAFMTGNPTDGFIDDWNEFNSSLTRVTSGTNGIPSSDGSAHGLADTTGNAQTGIFSRLGGYSTDFGGGFRVSQDVYMDLSDPAVANDTYGWDLSAAVNGQDNNHRRDFIFHTASNAAGEILVGGSNNTNFTRRNDLASLNNFAITTTGWYTFEFVFRDQAGTLAVDLNLLDDGGTVLFTETRNDPSDLISTVVGGNRYLWFTFLEVETLAIDNTLLERTAGGALVTYDPPSGTAFQLGDTEVTRTEDFGGGNTLECTFVVTVEDTLGPVFDQMVMDTTVDCVSDTNSIVLTATDACDGPVEVTSTLTFTEITDTNIEPSHGFVYVPNPDGSVTPIMTSSAPLDLPIGSPVTNLNLTSFSSPQNNQTRRWRARNPNAFPVEVRVRPANGSGPIFYFFVPANTDAFFFTEAVGGSNTTRMMWLNEGGEERTQTKASSNALTDLTLTSNICFTYQQEFTTMDSEGNVSMTSRTVFVNCDTEDPTLECSPITVFLDENGMAMIENDTALDTLFDNCDMDPSGPFTMGGPNARTFDCSFADSTFTRTVVATDMSGNQGSCVYEVTVLDTIPPTLECSAITVFLDENGMAMIENDTALDTLFDNCDMDPSGPFTMGGPNARTFDCSFADSTFTRTVVASDMSGNQGSCVYEVTVLDTIPPTLECSAITVFLDENGMAMIENDTALDTLFDNCDMDPSGPFTVGGPTFRMFDCSFVDSTFTRTVVASDMSGNQGSCVYEVTVLDTVPPVLECVDAVTIYLDEMGVDTLRNVQIRESESDNCTMNPQGPLIIGGPPARAFDCTFADMTVDRQFFIRDMSGNESDTCTVAVTILDTIPPTVVCSDTTVFLDQMGMASVEAMLLIEAEDNCSVETVSDFNIAFNCDSITAPGMTRDFTLTAADPSGNETSCIASITVLDTLPPVIICQNTEVILDAAGMGSITAEDIDGGTTDNCDADPELMASMTDFGCDNVGENMVTLTATDDSGNDTTCVAIVTVRDTTPPVITTTDQTITLNGQGLAQLSIGDLATATDACGVDQLFADRELIFDCEDIGENELTITAIDVNGNEATATVNVTVLFEEPELGCITEINVTLDENCQEILTPQMVLAGNTICLEQFAFDIVVEDNDPTNGAIIDGCGQFTYTIAPAANPGPDEMVLTTFEGCWGFVNAEDKISPVDTMLPTPAAELFCEDISLVNINELPSNVSRCWTQSGTSAATLNGSMNPQLRARLIAGGNGTTYVDADGNTVPNGIPNFFDGCSSVEICVNDLVSGNNGDCEDVVITRVFTATDGDCPSVSGEENEPTVVSYQITFTRPSISDVSGVDEEATFDCDANPPLLPANGFGDENPAPVASDYPFFTLDDGTQVFLDEDGLCNLGATFQDGPRIITCDQTYKFVRTFTVIDWCEVDSIDTYTQLVKVGDFDAPTITAPTQDLDFNGVPDLGPLFYSTNTADCEAIFAIPAGSATDNCDPNPNVTAVIYPNGDTLALGFGPYNIGELTLAGNGGIPAGMHLIRYTAVDDCGNFSQIDVELTIGDQTAPVAICEDGLNVSIGGPIGASGGIAQLCAEDVNAASYDDCSDIELAIRLTEVNGVALSPFDPLNQFQACHTLTCDQLGTVEIELRVTDDANNDGNFDPQTDNVNFCWLDILVEDKTAPICLPPAPLTIACNDLASDFPQDLNVEFATDPVATAALLDAQFGAATGLDNCPDPVVTQTVVDGRNSCGVGLITRTFTVTDGEGFTAPPGCGQTINVIGIHDYTIVFPGDQESDQCIQPDYNGVNFEENGCDLIAVSTTIDTFTATADECYKLRIVYEVINWCEYNTIDDAYVIPRDADGDGILDMDTTVVYVNPFGPGLEDDVAFLDRDVNRNNFNGIGPVDTGDGGILPGTSVNGYGQDGSRGAYNYTQFIKIYDDTPPTLVLTDSTDFCSFDGVNCDADVALDFSIDDECSPESVNATVELDAFIDPGPDGIYTLAEFEADGGNVTDAVTNNGDGSFTINLPNIPIGRHALRIRATDGCGNTAIELLEFEVADCKAPTPICINGLTVTLMPDGEGGGMAAIWVSDFIASPSDDCSGPVKFAIYLDEEVAGDPNFVPNVIDTGLVLTCDELGPQTIRIYAIDGMGQSDYCQTSLLVQAFNPTVCGPGPGPDASLSGAIMTPIDEMMNDVQVDITSDAGMTDAMFTTGGLYSFTELTVGDDYTVQPTHNPAINLARVTTADLIAISRHILGLQTITDTYQLLAADVTQEQTINILDIIAIRRVILGLDAEFNNTNSWRFYATEELLENWTENNLDGNVTAPDFVAVEMGNVNQTALSLSGSPANGGESEGRGSENIVTEDIFLLPNVESTITVATNGGGFQGTFQVAPGVEIVDVVAADANATAFNLTQAASGLIAFSHTGGEGFELTLRATAKVKLSDVLSLTDRITPTEAYPLEGGVADLGLSFVNAATATSELFQNSPNPFATQTQIAFSLETAGTATLLVQNQNGQLLRSYEIDAAAGRNLQTITRQELGNVSGVLTYTIIADGFTATRKMIVQ